jgi:23S rRNA pseudouridine1911/1915/1917 synthase
MLVISRSCIQKWIESGFVQVNDRKEPCNYRTKPGDIIEVAPQKVGVLQYAKPQDISLDIVYEDEHLLVVNKPAGMVTHPAPGHYEGTLVNALLGRVKRLSRLGGEFRPGIVHRLDKDTSGLIIIAKDENVHYKLAEQFKKREVYRQYIAIVLGSLKGEQGTITASLGRHPKNRKKFCVCHEKGREAITRYRVLERGNNATLLEIFPITGRTHQIRVHLAHLGYPMLGDSIYGKRQGVDRQALHAKSIGFLHPVTGQYVRLESPLPDDMKKMWEMFVYYGNVKSFMKNDQ